MYTGGGGGKLNSFFPSLLYGTPAPNAERQHPEAWPVSTYGHLRGVPANKNLLTGIVPANKSLLTGTVPANKSLLTGTVFWSITFFIYISALKTIQTLVGPPLNIVLVLLNIFKKLSNKTQGPHDFFFILLVLLGNYKHPCIDTIKMVKMSMVFMVEAGELEFIIIRSNFQNDLKILSCT